MAERKISHENELPVGTYNFKDMVEEAGKNRLQFVDKTFFIEEVVNSNNKVMLFTRPRRFGKSTNLSMLYYFLSDEKAQDNRQLFNGLKVESNTKIMEEEQGKYPVIMLNLKDLKVGTLEEYNAWLAKIFSQLYRLWQPRLMDFLVEQTQKGDLGILEEFNSVLVRKADREVLQSALQQLTFYIYSATGHKPWILIDEYDGAIYNAFTHGYHRQALEMLGKVLGSALKDNEYFHKAVITGILRIVKESIFSGLNNIGVYSFQDSQYKDAFGFTAEEVRHLIEQRPPVKGSHDDEFKALSQWYNGYECEGVTIYNPWSIACYMEKKKLLPYWVNTAHEGIFRTLLIKGNSALKKDFSQLLLTGQIKKNIDESLNFSSLEQDSNQIWSIMLASGYLKIVDYDPLSSEPQVLTSPNYEVRAALKSIAASVLTEDGLVSNFIQGLNQLANEGNSDTLITELQTIFRKTISFHDLQYGGENFVHGFFLGAVAALNDRFIIRSNQESGDGRYDIALFPRENKGNKLGIVIEFKMARRSAKKEKIEDELLLEELRELAQKAIDQIVEKNYAEEFRTKQIGEMVMVGIAFSGKYLEGVSRTLSLT